MAKAQIKDLIPGKTYRVQVRAVNDNGEYSEWSTSQLVTVPNNITYTSTGISHPILAMSGNGAVVTIGFSTTHPFTVGNVITITGSSNSSFNLKNVVVASVTSVTGITVISAVSGSSTGGTATRNYNVSNQDLFLLYNTSVGDPTATVSNSGLLKSSNFDGTIGAGGNIIPGSEGNTGWAIDYAGYGVFNNVLVRGNIRATSGYFGSDSNTGWSIGSSGITNLSATNLLSEVDPSFESDWRDYWFTSGTSSSTRVGTGNFTSGVSDGKYSAGVFFDAAGIGTAEQYTLKTGTFVSPSFVEGPIALMSAVSAGTYTLSFDNYSNQITSMTLQVVPYIGATAQTTAYNSSVSVSSTITRRSVSFTLPANTDGILIRFISTSLTPSAYSTIFNIDAIQLESGSSSTAFKVASYVSIGASETYKMLIAQTSTSDPLFSVTADGQMIAQKVRLAYTGDVSLSSSKHSFQIGPDTGTNLRMDVNEIQSVSNGAANGISLNPGGGSVSLYGKGSSTTSTDSGLYVADYTSISRESAPVLYLHRWGTADNTTTRYEIVRFNHKQADLGGINIGNATAPSFRAPSDYRLKDNIEDFFGGVEAIKRARPRKFTFKSDETNYEHVGFIAHEYADVNPQFVMGEKDAVDADGNPIYQSIETGSIMPYVVAAAKELALKVEELESRLAALENK